MIKLREAILVEGRYDVNTVRQVVDTVVLETGGFRIFNNKEQLKVIRRIAETRGLIVLTDSDGAGADNVTVKAIFEKKSSVSSGGGGGGTT